MNLIESLNWRYATKKYSDRKVSADDLNKIIAATNLSASSAGLQPYRLFIVENQELRNKLGEGSFNGQIADSSHLLVFAAFEKITEEHIETYINHIASERGLPVEALADFKAALVNGILNRTDEVNFTWAARQAYIGLGTALIAAADLQIDSTPMEGFDADKFDELLNLKEKGLKSVVTLALGYRDEEQDMYAKFKKVRLAKDDFASVIS
ncbi:NAD(P)H-dependent oxidoreductase [Pedobacter sp. MR2016-24]|uniref:NAD(P)H-dependent oxidoreductase n=1 Tax=Pedobacter sp. MR2016-24 TaxID=2994466 RepID=UPI0022472A8D|nr:NAD(P)H-dependent oxidoreductase [Pedobacter sp. MR2016-24]MCX2485763.1 NAD(P)H-dependent oxidoreductase [Pedobacter sp. MR2016-24]